MSKKDEALRLALENICAAKLCEFNSMSSRHEMIRLMDEAIAAIREALAERFCDNNCTWLDHHPECDKAEQPAQQEPVAVYVGETWCGSVVRLYEDLPLETPLYTSPQPSKPWVGLTEEERHACTQSPFSADNYRAIEAKLKEKNA